MCRIRWAGNPYRDKGTGHLEPRARFEVCLHSMICEITLADTSVPQLWKELVTGQCRPWTPDQLEACGLVSYVYGEWTC